jgi:hypothetical protein
MLEGWSVGKAASQRSRWDDDRSSELGIRGAFLGEATRILILIVAEQSGEAASP